VKPRLLVIELHHLGDAVMSLPFVRGASASFEVHILCRPASAEVYRLLENPPVLHEWTPPWTEETSVSPRESLRATHSKGRDLATQNFTATACAWADPRTTLLAAFTGAPQRLGFPTNRTNFYAPDAPGRQSRLLLGRLLERLLPRLTHPLQSAPRSPHIQRWSQLADALAVHCDFSLPWIPAPPPPKNPKPILGIHRHARLPSKQWPMEKWNALLEMDALHSKFEIIEILPGSAGVTPANEIQTDRRDAHTTIPTPELTSLVAALSCCDAILCHDSLPAHLAAALGKPVVTLFGSGEPDWFAPFNNRHRVVQKRVCPLHPCIDRCGMPRYICLEEIQPAEVLRQLELLTLA
jgi:ADP-heptose:LPS heptosyltransferase